MEATEGSKGRCGTRLRGHEVNHYRVVVNRGAIFVFDQTEGSSASLPSESITTPRDRPPCTFAAACTLLMRAHANCWTNTHGGVEHRLT